MTSSNRTNQEAVATSNQETLNKISDGLFFIVGCSRSGTTLAKTILNSHPQIVIPPETYFFTSIARGFHSGTFPLQSMTSQVLKKWWIRDMPVEEKDFQSLMEGQDSTWQNLFLALLAALNQESEATRFGEKTVGHVVHAEAFLETYQNCQIIQMVRDPRAVFSSILRSNVRSNQVYSMIQEWSRSIRIHEKLKDHERYHCVKFEDLILNTNETLTAACRQLGLEFDEAMLDYQNRKEAGYSPEQTHHENTRKPIFTSNLHRWKKDLSASQIGTLEYGLAKEMKAMGYELTNTPVAFPKTRIWLSSIANQFSRVFIQKPRHLLKSFHAKKRQQESQS